MTEVDMSRVEAALNTAHQTFEWYASLHRQKGTQDGDEKAVRNAEFALKMEEGLSAFNAIKAERDAQAATIRALQEENERLRDALTQIMNPMPFSEHLDPRCCQHTFDDTCELFSDIARDALKDTPND